MCNIYKYLNIQCFSVFLCWCCFFSAISGSFAWWETGRMWSHRTFNVDVFVIALRHQGRVCWYVHIPSETFSRLEEIMPAALHWAGVATLNNIAAAKALELMPLFCGMQTTSDMIWHGKISKVDWEIDQFWNYLTLYPVYNSADVGCISYKEQHQAATWWNSAVFVLCLLWPFLPVKGILHWGELASDASQRWTSGQDGCSFLHGSYACNYNCQYLQVFIFCFDFIWWIDGTVTCHGITLYHSVSLCITLYDHSSWFVTWFLCLPDFHGHCLIWPQVIIPFRDRESHLILFKLPDRRSSVLVRHFTWIDCGDMDGES